MVVRRVPGYGIVVIFAKRAAFSRQKAPQSKNCGALQDGALRSSHQSGALLPPKCGAFDGRKWRECRPVFKCRCGAFVGTLFDEYFD